jgi:hypothetical protein
MGKPRFSVRIAATRGQARSCLLESLPEDIIVLILIAASTPDLGALIRSSPILYRVFSARKKYIFISRACVDLGPVMYDVVFYARMFSIPRPARKLPARAGLPRGVRPDPRVRDLPEETPICRLVLDYRQRDDSPLFNWTRTTDPALVSKMPLGSTVTGQDNGNEGRKHWHTSLSDQEALLVARLNAALQFFTDLWVEITFTELRKRSAAVERRRQRAGAKSTAGPPPSPRKFAPTGLDSVPDKQSSCTWAPSLAERQRFCQGLVRFQILMRVRHDESSNRIPLNIIFLNHFQAWENEQMSVAAEFDRHFHRVLRILKGVQIGPEDAFSDGARHPPQNIEGVPQPTRKPVIIALHRIMARAMAVDGRLRQRVLGGIRDAKVGSRLGSIQCVNGSWHTHEYRAQAWPRYADGNTYTEPEGDGYASPRTTPYGWADALAGEPGRGIWGRDLLIRQPPVPMTIHALQTWRRDHPISAADEARYDCWSWLGFMFWDRQRVEALKGTLFRQLKTGWVSGISGQPEANATP